MFSNFIKIVSYPFTIRLYSNTKKIIKKKAGSLQSPPPPAKKKYKKKKIPKALKQQVWLNRFGKRFERTCYVSWCNNTINCFTFDCGHNIPESKGGKTAICNLIPICRNCNLGMGNQYTIDEWNQKYEAKYFKTQITTLWLRSWFWW